MRRALIAVLTLFGGAGLAHAEPLVFRHLRLIDGVGGPPVQDATLVIDAGKVIGAGRDVRIPGKARIIDLGGKTVTPGLITDHAHLGLVDGLTVTADHYNRGNILRQLRQYEAYGVTTVAALGLNRPPLFDTLRAEMHAGSTVGADLFGVDQGIGVPDGGPPKAMLPVGEDQIFRPLTPDEARQAVDLMASYGTDLIKLWLDDFRNGVDKPPLPKMTPKIYEAVISEAHAKGLRVAAHIHDLDDAKDVVAAGVDIIAHGVRDRPVDAAFVEAPKTRGVWYIPTLELDEASYIFAEHPEWLEDPFLAASLQPALRAQFADQAWRAKTVGSPLTPASKQALAINQRNLKTLFDAGVKIGFGTDSGATAVRIPGWAEHRELKLMVASGLTPAQAVKVATGNAADLLKRDDRGVLTPGKRADFVILGGDPTVDIANFDKIESVWRGGVRTNGSVDDFVQNRAP